MNNKIYRAEDHTAPAPNLYAIFREMKVVSTDVHDRSAPVVSAPTSPWADWG